jgi:thiol:disulfide interchange protein
MGNGNLLLAPFLKILLDPEKMKVKFIFALWLVSAISLLALLLYQPGEAGDYLRTPIYDETADASQQISNALVFANMENKQVLLQFGANWCVWCHVLHHLFDTNRAIRKKIQSDYIVVLIDVNNSHNRSTVEKYGEPTQFGLPVIVVLDSDGKQLVTQSVVEFGENGGYSPQKVLAFLNDRALKK